MHSRGPVFSVFGMRVVWFFCCSHEVFNIFLARYVPKILPLPLACAKNGDQQFWIEKFHAAMRRLSMHQLTIQFFPFWGGREEGIFFPLVSNMFPSVTFHTIMVLSINLFPLNVMKRSLHSWPWSLIDQNLQIWHANNLAWPSPSFQHD